MKTGVVSDGYRNPFLVGLKPTNANANKRTMDTQTETPVLSAKKQEVQNMAEESYALIKAFEEKGYKVVIQHSRPSINHPLYGRVVARRGGKTICLINRVVEMDEKGKRETSYVTYTGVAHCSKKDTYCKKKGVNIAVKRAAKAWQDHN